MSPGSAPTSPFWVKCCGGVPRWPPDIKWSPRPKLKIKHVDESCLLKIQLLKKRSGHKKRSVL
jgi:hypothetical protein